VVLKEFMLGAAVGNALMSLTYPLPPNYPISKLATSGELKDVDVMYDWPPVDELVDTSTEPASIYVSERGLTWRPSRVNVRFFTSTVYAA